MRLATKAVTIWRIFFFLKIRLCPDSMQTSHKTTLNRVRLRSSRGWSNSDSNHLTEGHATRHTLADTHEPEKRKETLDEIISSGFCRSRHLKKIVELKSVTWPSMLHRNPAQAQAQARGGKQLKEEGQEPRGRRG